MMDREGFIAILKGEDSLPHYFLPLVPLGWAYAAAMRVRAGLYGSGLLSVRRLPCKVVSVGNLTAGGTGKTPMTALTTRMLADMGLECCVVARGYRGSSERGVAVASDGAGHVLPASEVGDEAALMAGLMPDTPIVVGAERYRAGLVAVERFRPDVVVLDDGYQHIRLHRDLDMLLLDAARPFGNGHTIPAGYLREPTSAIGRADIVVLTRADRAEAGRIQDTRGIIAKIKPGIPVIEAVHRPARLTRLSDGSEAGPGTLSGRGVFAFSGVADPASFSLILNGLSAKITRFEVFGDHHRYTREEMGLIAASAREYGAEFVVTTEKDAVKLSGLVPDGMDVYVLGVEVELSDGGAGGALDRLIREKLLAGR